ncbi:MAG: AmmeMemoRadiSam system protein B [Treponema sp.]|nr:AmmeMemoRadiSam system protein B [Treponema sp.]
MQIRDYSLPAGWFPRDRESVSAFLSEFKNIKGESEAAVAPHAGWYYSGRTAAKSAANLRSGAETIIVIGGHLQGGSPPLFAMEDAVKTPFGSMIIDDELRAILIKELNGTEDRYRDNTVEVLLPMVHFFFPDAKLIWLRLASDDSSFKAGETISRVIDKLNSKVNVIASTDLTHYGKNYGFSPKGSGEAALKWAREVNDAAFIKAVESGDSKETLRRAEEDHSSCSAGAVLAAMGFAKTRKLGKARLLEYTTSADADKSGVIPDSFVGYASIVWQR